MNSPFSQPVPFYEQPGFDESAPRVAQEMAEPGVVPALVNPYMFGVTDGISAALLPDGRVKLELDREPTGNIETTFPVDIGETYEMAWSFSASGVATGGQGLQIAVADQSNNVLAVHVVSDLDPSGHVGALQFVASATPLRFQFASTNPSFWIFDEGSPTLRKIEPEAQESPPPSMRSFAQPVDIPVAQYPMPGTVNMDDWIPLANGGYASVMDATYSNDDTHAQMFLTFVEADPLVKTETVTTLNGHLFSKVGAGDGINPFPIIDIGNPTPGMGTHVVEVDRKYPGEWRIVTTLTHVSGRTVVHEHDYTVTGTATIDDAELYVAGLPVPQYAEDWQAISDIHGTNQPNKRDAAQAKADVAPPRPTPESHPYQFALNAQTNPPPDIALAITIANTGKTAGSDGINLYEAQAETNIIAAMVAELTHYEDIINSWATLEAISVNPAMVAAARLNRQWTSVFTDGVRRAYGDGSLWPEVEGNWQTYQAYMAWFEKQKPDEVVDMRTWDITLSRPA